MAVIVDYVKVRHSAVALLLPGLVFKVLQGHTFCESVNTQDLRWLMKETKMLIQNTPNEFSIQDDCLTTQGIRTLADV